MSFFKPVFQDLSSGNRLLLAISCLFDVYGFTFRLCVLVGIGLSFGTVLIIGFSTRVSAGSVAAVLWPVVDLGFISVDKTVVVLDFFSRSLK